MKRERETETEREKEREIQNRERYMFINKIERETLQFQITSSFLINKKQFVPVYNTGAAAVELYIPFLDYTFQKALEFWIFCIIPA